MMTRLLALTLCLFTLSATAAWAQLPPVDWRQTKCGSWPGWQRNKPPSAEEQAKLDREYEQIQAQRTRERDQEYARVFAEREAQKEKMYAQLNPTQRQDRQRALQYGINLAIKNDTVYTINGARQYIELGDLLRCTKRNADAVSAYDSAAKILKRLATSEAKLLSSQVSTKRAKVEKT